MLKLRPVLLDIEGFRHKKSGLITEELSVCTHNYSDTIFRPSSSFNIISSSEQKSYQWVSKFHGLAWETRDYPYCYLQQILQSIKLRFPFSESSSKGSEKADILKKLLQNHVINFETLCPKVENLKLYSGIPICELHAVSCPKRQRSRHCATKKAKLFYQWLTNRLEKSTPSLQVNLSPNLTVYSYITVEDKLTVKFVKEEKFDTRGQTALRKQQFTCTDTELETLKK